jgi:hypothetical protein
MELLEPRRSLSKGSVHQFLFVGELFHEFQVLISTRFTNTREFSRRAMERLVLIAYEKYMVIILRDHKDTAAS